MMGTESESYVLIVRCSGLCRCSTPPHRVKPSVAVWTDPHAITAARVRVASLKEQLASGANSLSIASGAKTLKGELWLKPL